MAQSLETFTTSPQSKDVPREQYIRRVICFDAADANDNETLNVTMRSSYPRSCLRTHSLFALRSSAPDWIPEKMALSTASVDLRMLVGSRD